MNSPPPHEELIEMAAPNALGILSRDETSIFDNHLGEGCEVCRTELASFESVISGLGLSVDEIAPPPGLLEELLSNLGKSNLDYRVRQPEESARDQFLSVYSSEGEWRPLMEGVLVKQLSVDKATGYATSLVRMLPGTHLPRHRHEGVEQFFVLEGDCLVHGDVLGPGDYHRAEAGSIHETTFTEGGTLFLLIAPESYRMLDKV